MFQLYANQVVTLCDATPKPMSSTDGNGWLNLNQMSSGSALKRPSDGWHDDLQEKLHFPAKSQRRAAAEGLCQWKKKWRRNLWFRFQNTKQVSSSPDKELESFAAQSDGGGDTKCGTCDVLVCRTSFDVDGHRADTGGSLFVEQKKKTTTMFSCTNVCELSLMLRYILR